MHDATGEAFDIRPYLAPLIRYRGLVLTFCLTATVSSLLFTYVVSEKYLATTTILYQPREAVSFRPKTRDALGFPMPLVPLESIGNTLEEVIKSDAVLKQVVETLRLDVPVPRPPAGFWVTLYRDAKDQVKQLRTDAMQLLKYGRFLPRDPLKEAMQTLEQNIGIKKTNKAYTFELQALNENPERAAIIVDTLAKVLADFLAAEQAKEAKVSRENIEPRLQQSAQEIAQMRDSLDQLKRETGVASLAEELSLRLQSVSEMQQELAQTQTELRALESKRTALNAQLQIEQPSVKYSSTTTDNPLVEQLRLDLARLDIERSGLMEKFTANHQEVRAVDAKIQQARDRLGKELDKIVSSESVGVNDIYQKLLADKLANDADIARLTAKAQSLAATVQRETATTRSLTSNEPRLNELSLQLKAAEDAYQLLNEAYEEARLTESKVTSEVAVLSNAIAPTAPARPIKILHVGTSLVLSLVLAVGFCLFVSAFDTTIRGIAQAERALGVPVFATIPAVPGGADDPARL